MMQICPCLTFLYFCEPSASVQLLPPEVEGWAKESQHFKLPSWQAELHHLHLPNLGRARPDTLLLGSPAGVVLDAAIFKTEMELMTY